MASGMVVRIIVELADKSDWVKVFDPRDCTIFVASDNPPEVGVQTRVDVTIGREGPRVILHGRVIARRPVPDEGRPPGCSIAVGFEDREKINYLNGYVRGGLLNLRELRRLPLRLKCTYGGIDGPKQTHTRDINERGVFVVSETPLPEQSEVHMRIEVPGVPQPLALAGIVSHTVVVEDEDVPGMGILFKLDEPTRRQLKEIIDRLEHRFVTADLPDEVLM
jgi:Tfp pilus assembly protein PilZ